MGLSETSLLLPADGAGIVLRLSLAIFAGALIGWEREAAEKPAGLRTHMLVSFGSAMFVLTSIQTGAVEQSADVLSRVMQGVIAGIGFLGAGEIFSTTRSDSDQIRVKGLTSAAAIWVSASLGVVMGCGLWQLGLLGAGMTFLILWGVKKFER
ncbi:MgtC/SapB family protein [Oculatella sp. FACHB-28]|uniref:MgtC/SapB family protein n=1 Tax=Oculatella sp. FACHB-28 TaxID=2692845 RepID=UPI0016825A16|nr:MgtC/SapB family protein [Oculatella sp. FACHB-28]